MEGCLLREAERFQADAVSALIAAVSGVGCVGPDPTVTPPCQPPLFCSTVHNSRTRADKANRSRNRPWDAYKCGDRAHRGLTRPTYTHSLARNDRQHYPDPRRAEGARADHGRQGRGAARHPGPRARHRRSASQGTRHRAQPRRLAVRRLAARAAGPARHRDGLCRRRGCHWRRPRGVRRRADQGWRACGRLPPGR